MYVGQWRLSPLQSRHLFGDLTQFSQSPSAAPSYFPKSHWGSEISSLSKVISVLGKARSLRVPNLGCRGAKISEWFDVSPKISAQDVMHEQVCCCEEAANHQLPIAAAFWIIQIFLRRNVQGHKIWCRFIALLAQSFWMRWPHSAHAHSMVSTAPTD